MPLSAAYSLQTKRRGLQMKWNFSWHLEFTTLLDVRNIFELFPLPCFQIPFAKHNIKDVNSEQARITETHYPCSSIPLFTPSCHSIIMLNWPNTHFHRHNPCPLRNTCQSLLPWFVLGRRIFSFSTLQPGRFATVEKVVERSQLFGIMSKTQLSCVYFKEKQRWLKVPVFL